MSKIDKANLIYKLKFIEDLFYALANFEGLLKLAFFQRTVSAEIQHVISGVPHSPERTIGNELFYLAADNVARRYCECLNIPSGKWDGFITFIPPITEGDFYGAFYNPSPYLKLFHVSMSEEAKYFVGSYLALAHEFCHPAMKTVKMNDAFWLHTLFESIYEDTSEHLTDLAGNQCENCPFYVYLSSPENSFLVGFVYHKIFKELLTDIIATLIGGVNYIHQLINFAYSMIAKPENQLAFLLRIGTCSHYLKLNGYNVSNLEERIIEISDSSEDIRREKKYFCPQREDFDFFKCIAGICALWAERINTFDQNYGENFYELLTSVSLEGDTSVIPLPKRGDSLFSKIVREGAKFEIDEGMEEKIKEALKAGIPTPDKDPRQILHCYYEAYKESDGPKRPHYAATIYSLAFNTFSQNRRERG